VGGDHPGRGNDQVRRPRPLPHSQGRLPRCEAGSTRRGLMFTGLVEEIGDIVAVEAVTNDLLRVTIASSLAFAASLGVGDSVSVSGCCLTVVARNASARFEVEVMTQTRELTAPLWQAGTSVNLERAMRAGGSFGGHIVSGHV